MKLLDIFSAFIVVALLYSVYCIVDYDLPAEPVRLIKATVADKPYTFDKDLTKIHVKKNQRVKIYINVDTKAKTLFFDRYLIDSKGQYYITSSATKKIESTNGHDDLTVIDTFLVPIAEEEKCGNHLIYSIRKIKYFNVFTYIKPKLVLTKKIELCIDDEDPK